MKKIMTLILSITMFGLSAYYTVFGTEIVGNIVFFYILAFSLTALYVAATVSNKEWYDIEVTSKYPTRGILTIGTGILAIINGWFAISFLFCLGVFAIYLRDQSAEAEYGKKDFAHPIEDYEIVDEPPKLVIDDSAIENWRRKVEEAEAKKTENKLND